MARATSELQDATSGHPSIYWERLSKFGTSAETTTRSDNSCKYLNLSKF